MVRLDKGSPSGSLAELMVFTSNSHINLFILSLLGGTGKGRDVHLAAEYFEGVSWGRELSRIWRI